jgi:pimeloyl-ACP methyl ester carboxylesterase
VRGWFATSGRYINQFAAFIITIFRRRPYSRSQKRKAAARKIAWENWWKDPRGTFNAIAEQELGVPSPQQETTGSIKEELTSTAAPPSLSNLKLNNGPKPTSTALPQNTPQPQKSWKIWRRASSEQELNLLSKGTTLFGPAAASPLLQTGTRRGLLEDARLLVEVGIAQIFGYIRKGIRKVCFLESQPSTSNRRGNTGKSWENLHVFTASDAILRAGYPLEEHSVVTSDGYVLQLHRIPRRGGRDVVFMMHGVLDTSLGWVVGGTGSSAALEAYDAGFDIWLANTRSNPPRLNTNPEKKGSLYWPYSANELAMCDVTAQISHIHGVKVAELATPGKTSRKSTDGASIGGSIGRSGLSRSATEACLSDITGDSPEDIDKERSRDTSDTDEISLMVLENNKSLSSTDQTTSLLRRVQSAEALPGCDCTFSRADTAEDEHPTTPITTTASLGGTEVLPYRLQAVGHSLGAALLLLYAVGSSMKNQPHRIRRLILLSPAGFHARIPLIVRACKWVMPMWTRTYSFFFPRKGMGLRLPTTVLRWFAFKILADVRRSPALLDLMKAGLSVATSGDTSEWTAAISLPHYAPQSMPAISLHSANHFAQWANDGNFRFYDYGSAAKNEEHYGEGNSKPPSVAENYWRLADIPVDLVAGSSDGLIPAENVQCHYDRLKEAGVSCTFRLFAHGHLDFTFGIQEEVSGFIIQRLRRSAWGGGA